MNTDEALEILDKNRQGIEGSFVYSLYEECVFSKAGFWDFYDCVITLAKDGNESVKNFEVAGKITFVYQWFLKEIIWHFDPNDAAKQEHFPENYTDYIERLDGAMDAYFRGVFADDSLYELQR